MNPGSTLNPKAPSACLARPQSAVCRDGGASTPVACRIHEGFGFRVSGLRFGV